MLKVTGLTGYYGSKCAVDHISFQLEKGEILGLLGPNGAGKSTTMNMITGYLAADEGEVQIDGIDISKYSVRARAQIGYLPEKLPLYPDMTVKEYLNFMFRLKKIRMDREKHVRHVCEQVRIWEMKDRLIRSLSKGYGQRVGIAQAMLGEPPVLILDEPSVGLDPRQIVEIRELIRQMGKNRSVILSSHILTEIQAVCDRVILIHQGKILVDDSTENLVGGKGGMRRFTVFLRGGKAEKLPEIAKLPHVTGIKVQKDPCKEIFAFTVNVNQEYQTHEVLLKAILQSGWDVDRLYWNQTDLEDIFMSMTAKGEGV